MRPRHNLSSSFIPLCQTRKTSQPFSVCITSRLLSRKKCVSSNPTDRIYYIVLMTLAYNGLHNDDDPGLDSDDGTRIEFRMEPVLKRSRRLTPKDIALDYSCRTQDPDGFRVELFETKSIVFLNI